MIDSLGHYKILDRIGSGAMGDLYRARDTRVGRTVALRVVAPSIAGDAARLDRFLADARASAAASHPNIAAIYEVADEGGVPYLACEFVQGQKLKGLVSGRALNPRRAIDLTIQIADALADADASGVAHGHLAADTVIVNAKGNAKLLDVGMAAWTSAGAGTQAGDHQADIAALGLVLHEMLTGKTPKPGTSPSDIDAHLPRELDAIVKKTQPGSLDERYEASATLAAELRAVAAILDGRTNAAKEIARVPSKKGARRREAAVWLTAIAMTAILAWLVWTASRM
jgi:serine/threonine-protein kinase